MSVTIHIVRHGETEENAKGLYQGQTPGHLSQSGKKQAEGIRQAVAEIKFDLVLCSDLKRCLDTAEIALDGKECIFVKEPLLRERDLGNLVGTPIAGSTLNETVESDEAVGKRAEEFLKLIKNKYDNKTILIFSHGFFLRVLQSKIAGLSHREIPLMGNCEIRTFEIE